MYSLFLTLSDQSIAFRAPAVHGVSSNGTTIKEEDSNDDMEDDEFSPGRDGAKDADTV